MLNEGTDGDGVDAGDSDDKNDSDGKREERRHDTFFRLRNGIQG